MKATWKKSLGRWWLGPMTDPLAMITTFRGGVEIVVYPHSPNPIASKSGLTLAEAKAHAEAVIRENELTPAVQSGRPA